MDSPVPGRFFALFSRLAGGGKLVAWLSFTVAGRIVRTVFNLLLGGFIVIVILAIYTLNQRPDLSLWHEVRLDGEFTEKSDASTFTDYLAIEEALFSDVKKEVYAITDPGGPDIISRYRSGSPANPEQYETDWNVPSSGGRRGAKRRRESSSFTECPTRPTACGRSARRSTSRVPMSSDCACPVTGLPPRDSSPSGGRTWLRR